MPITIRKPAEGIYKFSVDISKWPMNPGETVVSSNSRGPLSATFLTTKREDVTSDLTEGSPWIVDQTTIGFWLKGGEPGKSYYINLLIPTSDEELLPETILLQIVT